MGRAVAGRRALVDRGRHPVGPGSSWWTCAGRPIWSSCTITADQPPRLDAGGPLRLMRQTDRHVYARGVARTQQRHPGRGRQRIARRRVGQRGRDPLEGPGREPSGRTARDASAAAAWWSAVRRSSRSRPRPSRNRVRSARWSRSPAMAAGCSPGVVGTKSTELSATEMRAAVRATPHEWARTAFATWANTEPTPPPLSRKRAPSCRIPGFVDDRPPGSGHRRTLRRLVDPPNRGRADRPEIRRPPRSLTNQTPPPSRSFAISELFFPAGGGMPPR